MLDVKYINSIKWFFWKEFKGEKSEVVTISQSLMECDPLYIQIFFIAKPTKHYFSVWVAFFCMDLIHTCNLVIVANEHPNTRL